MTSDLQADLDEALVWLARSARGELRGTSAFLYDLTKALYKAGLTEEAATVVAHARKLIESIPKQASDETRAEALGYILKALAIAEPAEEVRGVLADGSRITRIQLTGTDTDGFLLAVCESLLDDTGDVPKAVALISGITGDEPKDYAYGHVCQALARLGQASNALELASRISDKPPSHHRSFSLTRCVEALCELGAVDDAITVAKQIGRDGSRSNSLLAAAQRLAEAERAADATAILEEALAIPREVRSEQENALLGAVGIQATLGKTDEALTTANLIERQRPRHSRAIAYICREVTSKGDLQRALTLTSLAETEDVALLSVVEGLTSAGRFKEAEEVLGRIRNDEQRWDGWEALALRLAEGAKATEAVRIADHFPKELSYKADTVIQSLAVALAKEGKYPEARETVVKRWRSDPISRVEALAAMWPESRAALEDAGTAVAER